MILFRMMLGGWNNSYAFNFNITGTGFDKTEFGVLDYFRAIAIMFLPPIVFIRNVTAMLKGMLPLFFRLNRGTN